MQPEQFDKVKTAAGIPKDRFYVKIHLCVILQDNAKELERGNFGNEQTIHSKILWVSSRPTESDGFEFVGIDPELKGRDPETNRVEISLKSRDQPE